MSDQDAQATEQAGSIALVCPYCGATLRINLETEGRPYFEDEVPESIECYAYDCKADWEPNGVPRSAPRWERCPVLYDEPHLAIERRTRPVGGGDDA